MSKLFPYSSNKCLNPLKAVVSCDWPSLCQSVVAEVQDELVQRVRLDLSHLLFLFLHNLHWGFLQSPQVEGVSSVLRASYHQHCLRIQTTAHIHTFNKKKQKITHWHSSSTSMQMKFCSVICETDRMRKLKGGLRTVLEQVFKRMHVAANTCEL